MHYTIPLHAKGLCNIADNTLRGSDNMIISAMQVMNMVTAKEASSCREISEASQSSLILAHILAYMYV